MGGWLADRVGRKPVMVVSITCTAVVIAAMGLVHDLAWVAALTLVLGLVDPPFVPAARAAVADVVPSERRPRAYGLLGMAASVGWIVGPSLGAGLSGLGFGLLFLVAGAIIGCYTVILLSGCARPARQAAAAANVGFDRAPAGTVGGRRARRRGLTPGRRSLPFDARRILALFLVLAVAFHGAQFMWVAVLPIYAYADLGVSTATWGLLFALNGILILALQLRVTSAAERRSRPRFMAVGAILSGIGYLVVAAIPGVAIVLPLLGARHRPRHARRDGLLPRRAVVRVRPVAGGPPGTLPGLPRGGGRPRHGARPGDRRDRAGHGAGPRGLAGNGRHLRRGCRRPVVAGRAAARRGEPAPDPDRVSEPRRRPQERA